MRLICNARIALQSSMVMFIFISGLTSAANLDYQQQYNMTLAEGESGHYNPWILPPAQPEKQDETRWPERYHQQPESPALQIQQPRFVTPEILQSLKQQQTQTQQVRPQQQGTHRRFTPNQRQQYGVPSYDMGYSPEVYDVPMVSPWAESPDTFYQGRSLPMVPDAAIGGIPPMQMPVFGDDSFDDVYDYGNLQDNNVFNPFTFIPNGDLNRK